MDRPIQLRCCPSMRYSNKCSEDQKLKLKWTIGAANEDISAIAEEGKNGIRQFVNREKIREKTTERRALQVTWRANESTPFHVLLFSRSVRQNRRYRQSKSGKSTISFYIISFRLHLLSPLRSHNVWRSVSVCVCLCIVPWKWRALHYLVVALYHMQVHCMLYNPNERRFFAFELWFLLLPCCFC